MTAPAQAPGLPLEPGSSSDLLYATHVMLAEVYSVKETPWVPGPVGQRRILEMTFKLADVLKGRIDLRKGKTFEVKGEQHSVDPFVIEDVPGLWSHLKPAAGMTYLVLSVSPSTDPAELMKEKIVRGLMDGKMAGDVKLAIQAESKDQPNGALQKLTFAKERRAAAHDLFARYLWARVRPELAVKPAGLLPDVLALITAKDAPVDFRGSLISDLSSEIGLEEEPSPALRIPTTRAYCTVLLQPESERLHQDLVRNEIPGLVFHEEKAIFPATAAVSEEAERKRLKKAVKAVDPDESQALIDWLDGK